MTRLCLALLACVAASAQPGKDLRLHYRSAIDGAEQPYRVYVPAALDVSRPVPVVLFLHGTGGTESSIFEEKRLPPGAACQAAEKHGLLLVSPLGRGTTEYRGTGEHDVLSVLEDVKHRWPLDPDRIYVTGQSMGGTGSAYLALHHPHIFAAAAPLAAAYSFPWLAANARHVPFWWLAGANDARFYLMGIEAGVERMKKLGLPVLFDKLPGEGHDGGLKRLDDVFGWLARQRRSRPREYVFEVDTPLHGRAYWTDVRAIARPGEMAVVRAAAEAGNALRLDLDNVASIAFLPDPALFEAGRPIAVTVNTAAVFRGRIAADSELLLTARGGEWKAAVRRRAAASPGWRRNPVAVAPEKLDMDGVEARLANWIADAMRAATGADIALYNRMHYRGLPIPSGKVDIIDLIECSRPFDQYLVLVELNGRDLVEILEANAGDPGNRLVQLSGAQYTFDPARPDGGRIVWASVIPNRRYLVALEGQVVERETIRLAGRFGKLDYKTTAVPFSLALYGRAARLGRIEARAEGRVRQGGPVLPVPPPTAPLYGDKTNLLRFLDPSGADRPVRTAADWARRRGHILANMEQVMGPLPRIDHRLPLDIKVLKEVRTPKYTWRRITYAAEPGDRVPAYLYVPAGLRPGGRAPGVVSLHGTTYARYSPEAPAGGDTHYAEELAERGYVVVAPDYVLLNPDYRADPYALGYVSGTMKGIVNHIRAVDLLLSMREVDPRRIGSVGLSLGGHNALFLAVFDPRVAAAVSSAGFNTFAKYYGGDLRGWSSNRYMPRIALDYGAKPERMPFDFTEVLAAIAPRAVFVNAPLQDDNFEVSGARDCVAAALPVYKLFGAESKLVAQYPEGGHGFSEPARRAAYEFLDTQLRRRTPAGRTR